MTKLLYFTRTQKGRRECVSLCFGIEEMRDLYSSGKENMNGKEFNKG